VEPVYYPTFSDSYTDLAIGKVDATSTVLIDLLPAIKNNDLHAVMITDATEGIDSIVATPDIASIYGLRGKRIGVELGTFAELLVIEMLAKAGLDTNDVNLVNIPPDQVPSAIPSLIDAGHTWDPHTAQAIASGNHIIFSTKDTPGLFPDVMTFRVDVIQHRPDDVRAFVAAWFEAADYWLTNPQAGNTIVAQYTGQLASEISTEGLHIYTLQDNLRAFAENPGSNLSSIYYVARLSLDFSIKAGYITIPPDLNILLDPSFLK
jgi:NitT/TauT family transport system substrate-binding protein